MFLDDGLYIQLLWQTGGQLPEIEGYAWTEDESVNDVLRCCESVDFFVIYKPLPNMRLGELVYVRRLCIRSSYAQIRIGSA